jgi:hypothetical protein
MLRPFVIAVLGSMLLAGVVHGQPYHMTIDIEGEGKPPKVTVKGQTPTPPPVADRDGDGIPDGVDQCPDVKGVAPSGCPVVVPPVVPRDMTPFVLPTNCVARAIDQSERYIFKWEFPGDFQDFYSYLDGTGNPLINSHTCAGVFGPNAMTPPMPPTYPNGKSLANGKLWIPRTAAKDRPDQVRCILETGRVCP